MIEYKVVTKEVEEIEDIICDKCGNSTKPKDSLNFLYAVLTLQGAYGSTRFDMKSYKFYICEDCFVKITDDFIVDIDDIENTVYHIL